jgi:hypothetical protein
VYTTPDTSTSSISTSASISSISTLVSTSTPSFTSTSIHSSTPSSSSVTSLPALGIPSLSTDTSGSTYTISSGIALSSSGSSCVASFHYPSFVWCPNFYPFQQHDQHRHNCRDRGRRSFPPSHCYSHLTVPPIPQKASESSKFGTTVPTNVRRDERRSRSFRAIHAVCGNNCIPQHVLFT